MYFGIDFFCESCKESKSGICFTKVRSPKNLWTYAVSSHFLITMHEIDTAAKVYLETFQAYMIEMFCENS